ncbi:MAG: hypothetical protein OFPI_01430 [Osedax symbiont Rs2]|nr:MAG: hypothetical protein OFPI_01430 [Osedax symbiont Rs2]
MAFSNANQQRCFLGLLSADSLMFVRVFFSYRNSQQLLQTLVVVAVVSKQS